MAKHGGVNRAADALKIPRSTFKNRLWKEQGSASPPKVKKLNISGISEKAVSQSEEFTHILYFTDAHNQPGLSQDRFVWLARLVNDQKPHVIVDGGDGDDFHSLCSHERDDSYKGRLKPLLAADLECAAQARALLNKHLTHQCRKIITLGNHEHRIWSYEDANPAMYGIVSSIYTEILTATGWEYYPYGAYVDIAGVNFTHVPFNAMGKPVGGENAVKQVAEKSLKDVCYGHTHSLDQFTAHKFGSGASVKAFNGGSFMPSGYIPAYVKNTKKEFWYGAHMISVKDGRIKSIKSWHMDELGCLYA